MGHHGTRECCVLYFCYAYCVLFAIGRSKGALEERMVQYSQDDCRSLRRHVSRYFCSQHAGRMWCARVLHAVVGCV